MLEFHSRATPEQQVLYSLRQQFCILFCIFLIIKVAYLCQCCFSYEEGKNAVFSFPWQLLVPISSAAVTAGAELAGDKGQVLCIQVCFQSQMLNLTLLL